MTHKECYLILELEEGAGLDEIKRAYRRLAFALHPDLNPDVPGASQKFQRLNEAYVFLSQTGAETTYARQQRAKQERASAEQEAANTKAREDANRAYEKAKKEQGKKPGSPHAGQASSKNGDRNKEEVLKDILNDPFARRVFQDIYSHLQSEKKAEHTASAHPGTVPGKMRHPKRQCKKKKQSGDGLMGKVTGWLRKQIDEEQVLQLPKESLLPGARVRLDIQHGLSGEMQTLELTLPPNFNPGKAIRLKGMGRRVGSWRGDLYVRIDPV